MKLLSIAIPTWNRDKILEISLTKLLPQIKMFTNEIEFIISDNASTDNTQLVIQTFKEKNPEIDLKVFKQSENTGYYGNFKKCKELATGKYFWLLSDNEHIIIGVIERILFELKKEEKVGALFLDNNQKSRIKKGFKSSVSNFSELILSEQAYRLTLISAVIFLNEKDNQDYVSNRFKNNSFVGFLYVINGLLMNSKIVILEGQSFISYPCNVSFDIFKSWTYDILECVSFMLERKLLSQGLANKFIEGYLKHVLAGHVFIHQRTGILHKRYYGNAKQITSNLDKYYSDFAYYKLAIRPLLYASKLRLQVMFINRKFNNLFKRVLSFFE